MRIVRLGTRGSDLARWQAGFIRDALLAAHAGLRVEMEVISTRGDGVLDRALDKIPGKGLFTKEIEESLLDGRIDLAVHSLKDLPTQLPEGLALAAILKREDPADVLLTRCGAGILPACGSRGAGISPALNSPQSAGGTPAPQETRKFAGLDALPRGASVMTGSVRRSAQLLNRRPDLKILPIRGNVPTRVRKLDEAGADGLILAFAGLIRLGLAARVAERLDPAEFLPACGQGAMAVEIRRGDEELAALCRPLDDPATRLCVTAERTFLEAMGGGCQAPIGAYGRFEDGKDSMTLTGMVARPDGSRLVKLAATSQVGDCQAAVELGRRVAGMVLAEGVDDILVDVRRHPPDSKEDA